VVERDRPKRAARRHGAKSFLNRTAVRAGGVVLVVLGSGGTAQHGIGLGTEQEIHACRGE
jgi:hypothetical protein